MFSSKKGLFGYLKKQPVRIGLLTIVLLIGCASVFLIGFFTTGSSKNILTVIAVLGMLPVAKFIVSFIMYVKAEKYSCEKSIYDEIEAASSNRDFCRGYDFYLTSYSTNYPLASAFVHDGSVIALSIGKTDAKSCREHIEKYLSQNSIEGFKVYILDNKDKYLERIKSVDSDYQKSENDLKAYALLKSISL